MPLRNRSDPLEPSYFGLHTLDPILHAPFPWQPKYARNLSVRSRFLNTKIIKHLKRTPHLKLNYPNLDLSSLHIFVYSDLSFQNNRDYASQLGYIIVLADQSNRCAIIQYSSHKSKRVVRSSMAAETLAFSDAFDNAFIIKHDLQRMLGRALSLLMLTDSKILFDVLTRSKSSTVSSLR